MADKQRRSIDYSQTKDNRMSTKQVNIKTQGKLKGTYTIETRLNAQGLFCQKLFSGRRLIRGGLNHGGGGLFKYTRPEVYHMVTKSERKSNIL